MAGMHIRLFCAFCFSNSQVLPALMATMQQVSDRSLDCETDRNLVVSSRLFPNSWQRCRNMPQHVATRSHLRVDTRRTSSIIPDMKWNRDEQTLLEYLHGFPSPKLQYALKRSATRPFPAARPDLCCIEVNIQAQSIKPPQFL